MSQTGYVILAVVILVILVVIFFVSFLLYVRQKPPKGCENLGRDESLCATCDQASCRFYKKAEELEAKKREEKEKEAKQDESGEKKDDGDAPGKGE
jgi:hypothetical protein